MAVYGDVTEATTYHDARGQGSRWSAVSDQEAALQRATDYIDQRYREKLKSGRWASMFTGERTNGRSQENEWPRTGAQDYEGNEIPDDEVPKEVEHAAYEAALLEGEEAGSLSPQYTATEQVTSETVGPISVKYADTSKMHMPQGVETPNRPILPHVDEIISPVLTPRYDLPAVKTI